MGRDGVRVVGVIYLRRKIWSKSGRLKGRGMLGRVRRERRFWSEIYCVLDWCVDINCFWLRGIGWLWISLWINWG